MTDIKINYIPKYAKVLNQFKRLFVDNEEY